MTTKIKAKSRIFDAVHETATDLYRLGFINKRKMTRLGMLDYRLSSPAEASVRSI